MHGKSGRWAGIAIILLGTIAAFPFYRQQQTVEPSRATRTRSAAEMPLVDARPLQVESQSVPQESTDVRVPTAAENADKPQVTRRAELPKNDFSTVDHLVPLPSLPHNYVAAVPVPSQTEMGRLDRSGAAPSKRKRGLSSKRKTRSPNDRLSDEAASSERSARDEMRVVSRNVHDRTHQGDRFDSEREPGDADETITHRIVDGDSLARLAERYLGDSQLANALFEANRDVLSDPDLLPIGRELKIPLAAARSASVHRPPLVSREVEPARPTATTHPMHTSPATDSVADDDLVPLTYEERMALKARLLNSHGEP